MTLRPKPPQQHLHFQEFWREAFAWRGSITPHVIPNVLFFGLTACLIVLAEHLLTDNGSSVGLPVAPFEIAGAALGLLLVLRTNAGYDRWWEGRKLWGGIVNQSRNLVISGLNYGPADPAWQREFVLWAAVFPHVMLRGLRREKEQPQAQRLLGNDVAAELSQSNHPASIVSAHLARMLRSACERGELSEFAFLQVDRERATLIEHLGGCERILNSPLPLAYSINIRRFIAVFLVTLPFVLIHRLTSNWFAPLLTMLVAYPLVALDALGVELQNPFSNQNLSHLPLDGLCDMIEGNTLAMLSDEPSKPLANSTN